MNLELCQLWIEGEPKPQPRPRMTRRGHTYNPPSADAWKTRIRQACRAFFKDAEPLNEPLVLQVVFFLPRPKSHKGESCTPHGKKPDIDNLAKAAMDAMNGIVFKDDGCITQLNAEKWYTPRKPGAVIKLYRKGGAE